MRRLAMGVLSVWLAVGGGLDLAAQTPPEPAPDSPEPALDIKKPVTVQSAPMMLTPAIDTGNAVWVPIGPGPTINGQTESVVPNDEVVGAIHTVLAHPTDRNIMYIGSVNGGIWKTVNATAQSPTWVSLTDNLSSLSIGAMEFDPADPNRIIVGVGRFSSYGRSGGLRTGIQITTDAGNTWTEIQPALLQGRNISGVAVRGNTMLASANFFSSGGGLYRSTDNGANWTFVSGSAGLPTGGVHDLVGDPNNLTRFYAAVEAVGIFMSDDTGATWTNISANDPSANGVRVAQMDPRNNNTEMAVAPNGRLFVGVMHNGQGAAFGYADNNGQVWGTMDLPRTRESNGDIEGLNPRVKPGGQGAIHFSIAADPTDSNIFYVGGDRQDSPFPNFIGARDFSARIFRGNVSIAPTGAVPSPQWDHMTHLNTIAAIPNGGTASGSAPHADSREMVFDAGGDLIEVDDGGIYRRTQPRSNQGDWFSINGNLQVAEYHDIGYDPIAGVTAGGAQDAGTQRQITPGQPAFDSVHTGDGADIEVDYTTIPGQSILYASFQNLGFFARRVYDNANNLLSTTAAGLSGSSIAPQFNTPVELNRVDPRAMVIGGAVHVHESFDQGDNVRQITMGGGVNYFDGKPLVYGGFLGGVGNADIIWAGSGSSVFVRTNNSTTMSPTPATFPGGFVRSIEIASDDWRTAYVCDSDQVWMTTDVGANWTEITGTLNGLGAQDFHKLHVINTTQGDGILLGCQQGVFVAHASSPTQWSAMNGGLPNVSVWDIDYYAQDDVVVIGTMGRGAWRLNPLSGGPDIGVSGNGINILDGSTIANVNDGTEFPAVDINGGLATQVFVVTNNGSEALSITLPITFSGANPGDFAVTVNPAASVVAGGSTSFTVTFDPSAAGTRSAALSINNNDPNENPFNFTVAGVGALFPDIAVTGNGVTIANNDLSPTTLDGTDFGPVDILGGVLTNVFVITNTGPTNLSLTLPISISGTAAGDFSVVTNPPTNLGPGASGAFALSFAPGGIGVRSATLSIDNSDPDEDPYTFAVRGSGATIPNIDLFGNGNAIADGSSVPAVTNNTDFGGADITGGSVTHTFFVTNNGSASLNIFLPILFSGLHGLDFSVTAPPTTTIPTGGFTSFEVTFNPSGAGARTATMQINSDDPDESPYDVALGGTGLLIPEIGIFGNGVTIVDGDTTPDLADGTDFGNAIAGVDTVIHTFVITNQGSSNVTFGLPTISGLAAAEFVPSTPAVSTLATGEATTFTVTFAPTVPGLRTATLSLSNNDADENPYNFDLQGTSTEPIVAVLGNGVVIPDGNVTVSTSNATDFGTVDVSTGSSVRTYAITNAGDAVLSVSLPITFTGPAASDFILTSIPSSSIPPGGAASFNVTFNPNGTGFRGATLTFGNSDVDRNPYDFAIGGNGTGPDIAVFGNTNQLFDGQTNTAITDLTDFLTKSVALGSTTNTFLIRNAGSGDLRLTLPITILGDEGDFTVSRQPDTNSLLAGAFTTFDVVFDPVAGGRRFAVVNIESADSDENPFDFVVTGLGDGPEIALLGADLVITNNDFTPSILDGTAFGGADLNSGSVDRIFVVTNEGTQPLILQLPITISGTAAADFTVINSPNPTVSPGGSNSFIVRFDPNDVGTRTATVNIGSDDGDESPYLFDISGVGIVIPPTITSHPVGRNLNALQDTTLFVTANGTAPLTFFWFKDGVQVPGVNSAALALNDVTLADAGLYHVVVSNLAGVVTSAPAQVTVNLLPSVVNWNDPAAIVYGTPLGAGQLNAMASVPGTFVYSPLPGAVLAAGTHNLDVSFTPANPLVYAGSMASASIVVTTAPLTLRADDLQRLTNTANPTLTFTASGFVNGDNIPSLMPAAALSTTATMASPAGSYPITISGAANPNYDITFENGTLLVFEAAPAIVQQPISVTTNALSDVSFTVAATGVDPLQYQWFRNGIPLTGETSATLSLSSVTVADAAAYTVQVLNGSGSVISAAANLTVNRLDPVITWADPVDVIYGTALDGTQLNAGANVGGTFDYTPATGVLGAGTHILNVAFTPFDTVNYNTVNGSATLVVTNAPLLIIAEDKTREFGLSNPAFTFTAVGLTNGDTLVSLATQPMANTVADAMSLPGAYPVVVSGATSPNYLITHSNGTLTVFANSPMISDQPDAVTVIEGNSASFTVVAGGTLPLSYQWRLAGTPIPGATAAAYNIAATMANEAGAYDVVVSNVGGSVTSVVANLTVLVPPTITQQPVAQAGTAAGTVNFNVTAQGSIPLFYQWQKDGADLQNQTNALLTLANLSTNNVGDYRVVVTNDAGSVTSSIAALTISRLTPVVTWATPSPIAYGTALDQSQLNASANIPGSFTYTPALGAVPQGGAQNLSVLFTPLDTGRYQPITENRNLTVTPVPLTVTANDASREVGAANPSFSVSYQGFRNGDVAGSLTVEPTVTTVATPASPVGVYDLVPVGAMSANYTFVYNNGTLTVVAVPVSITQQPASLVVTQGMDATFSVGTAGSPPISHQWRRNGTNLVGQTAASLTITGATAADDASYDVIVANGANSLTSSVVTLDVLLPSAITWPTPANIVYGTALGTNELNAVASVPGALTYTPVLGTVLGAGTHALMVDFVPADTDTYLPTNATVNITVDPAILTITADSKFREFGQANPTLAATFTGFISGEDFNVLTAQPMLATTADINTLPGNVPITVTGASSPNYTINHVDGTLTVFANLPNITSAPASLSVTNGDPVTLSATAAGTAPLHLQWRFNGVPIADETNSTYTIAAAQTSDSGVYDLVVTNVAGMITSQPATLTVLVPPAITSQPQSQTFNAFSDVTFTVVATGSSPLLYQWTRNGQPLANETNSVLALTSVSPTDVGAYVVTVSNGAGAVTSDTAILSVNELAPEITWDPPAAITYGTLLSQAQLNASTFVPGEFVYNPAIGTVLDSGSHTLNVTFNPTDSTNFLSTNASVMITVNDAPLVVIAEDKSREFNTANPTFTSRAEGFVNGDDASVFLTPPMLGTAAGINSLPGDYPITISGATAANYAITHSNGTLNVFANAPNITQQPVDTATTNGLDTTLSVVATGTSPITYQWRKGGSDLTDETNSTFSITGAVPGTDDGAYDVVLANIAGSVTSQVANVVVLIPPSIIGQPMDMTSDALATVTFTVSASGTGPLRYQWRKDDVDIVGATNSSLALTGVTTNSAGVYSVVVSNDAGSETSAGATLTVNQLTPQITWSNPAAIVYGVLLGTNQLNAAANTTGAFAYTPPLGTLLPAGSHTLMMEFTPDDLVNYLPTSASVPIVVTTAPLTVTADNKRREFGFANPGLTRTFSGFVNNETDAVLTTQPVLNTTADINSGLGSYPITISGASALNYNITHVDGTLTVFGVPPTITEHPTDRTVAAGANVSFTNMASGTAPLSFQWRKAGISLPGQTNSILTVSNAGFFDSGSYDVVVSNIAGAAASFAAVLKVLVPPSFVVSPTNVAAAVGQPVNLQSVAIGTSPINYQWFKDGVLLTGETNANFSIPSANLAASGTYWAVANNIVGLSTSAVAQVTVSQLPSLIQQPVNVEVANGGSLVLSAQAFGQPPLVYRWLHNGVEVQNLPLNTYTIAFATTNNVGLYEVIVSNGFGQTQSQRFLVTISGVPLITRQPVGSVVLPGTNVVLEVIASGSQPLSYVWQRGGTIVQGAMGRTLTLTNITPAEAGMYSVAVVNAGGVVVSDPADVTVITPPVISRSPTNQVGAQGAALTLSVDVLSPVSPTYQWRFQGVPVGGMTNSAFPIASLVPANAGNYDVTVGNAAGSVTSQVATVSVLIAPTLLQQPLGQTVPVGQSATFSALPAGSGPLSFQWMKSGVDIPGANAEVLTLNGVSRGDEADYSVRVVNEVGSVNSLPAQLRVLAPQSLHSISGGRRDRFRFHFGDQSGNPLSAADASRFVVEVSDDLQNWTIVSSNGARLILTNGLFRYEDINSVVLPRRYYRVREQ